MNKSLRVTEPIALQFDKIAEECVQSFWKTNIYLRPKWKVPISFLIYIAYQILNN